MAYIKPTQLTITGQGLTRSASSNTGFSPITLSVNTATTSTLGVVKAGDGLSITSDGVLNVTGGGAGGYTGSQGYSGSKGYSGSVGYTGSQGSTGFSGSVGFVGSQGNLGYTGSASAGYTGSAGSTGTQGSAGFTGSAGSTGTQGSAGYAGSTGYTGSQGESSFTWGSTPPSSPVVGDRWYDTNKSKLAVYVNDGDSTQWVEVAASGFLGRTGYTGSAGAGYTGSIGSTGTQGSIGFTGSGGVGSTGPKISSVTVTDSSYNNLDDTAIALTGGYIKILGSGFESGCQVLLGTTVATSVSYISSSEVRAQLPAASTGTYIIYLVNSDGGTAIRVNAVTFSPTPSWTTGASLTGAADTAISIQLAATDATSFALAAGSSLPSGITLSSGGLLSGTITGLSADTAYNFTIVATDAELQDSTRAFTFTITIGDDYFKYVSLLLPGNGTNNAQNNTFIDSSTNNFSITRNGNVAQGTFTPYGSNWSNYFDGSSFETVAGSTNLAFGTGDFTIECWVNFSSVSSGTYLDMRPTLANGAYPTLYVNSGTLAYYVSSDDRITGGTVVVGTWYHIALCRSATSTKLFLNGTQVGSTYTDSNNYICGTNRPMVAGNGYSNSAYFNGYVSNFRFVKGTALYTTTFTPPTTPLTAISGTSLLICQSNRFVDNSATPYTITTSGSPSVQRFSPFSPTTAYSTSVIGGSGYFDGNGDYLTISDSNLALNTGDFTVECWINAPSGLTDKSIFEGRTGGTGTAGFTLTAISPTSIRIFSGGILITSGSINYVNTWCHVAVVRLSGTTTLYINGVSQGTTASLGNLTDSSFVIGAGKYAIPPSVDAFFTGYISNFRMVKGAAVYTSSFTPPTAPVTAISGTSLLLNYTNAGVIDNAMQNNIETVGDAKISTTQYKFGSGSLYFDGTGDYCFLQNTQAFLFGSGDFTIELWAYIGDTSTRKYILGPGTDTDTHYDGFGLEIWNQQLSMWASSNGTGWDMLESDTGSNRGSTLMAANTWYHIAVTRSGNTFRSFVNGVVEKTFTVSGTIFSNATIPYNIGRTSYLGGNFYYNGYMDDFRVTRGYARYTTNFTPPTSALPLK